ncbi:hypothetical protein [uncultured Maricaulis sp.]|uniref:hypothetical protein n=1 Tax=uncultured Maricaulis sp. TaxID=174710 RepID=UPI0030D78BD6
MDRLTRHVTPRRAGLAALVLLILVVMLLWLRGDSRQEEQRDILELLRAVEADYALPGLTVAEAAPVLGSPEASLDFVRDGVWLQFYDGRALTPDDVLVLRGANSADKAMLLAALISAQDLPVRLVSAAWPDAVPILGQVTSDRRESLSRLYAALEVDEERARAGTVEAARAIPARLEDGLSAAQALLARYWSGDPVPAPNRAAQAWVWLEYRSGNDWIVADPVFPDLPRPADARPYIDPGLTPIELAVDLVTTGGARQRLIDWSGRMIDEPVLSFLPSAELRAFLDSAPGEISVRAWRPVITGSAGAAAGLGFSTGGDLLPVPESGPLDLSGGLPPPPAIGSAELVAVDTQAWPEVALRVQTDTPDGALWYAPHLHLEIDGVAVTPRILAQPRQSPELVIITDVSPSMIDDGSIFSAGLLGRALVEAMERRDRFVAVPAAAGPRLAAPSQLYFGRRDAVLAYNSGLLIREGDDLPAALRLAAAQAARDAVFLVMTDGRLGADEAGFLAAIEALPGRVFGVVPESETDRFQRVFDRVWALPPDDRPSLTAASIRQAFGTQLDVRFTAPDGASGDIQALDLTLGDRGVAVAGEYAVPDAVVGLPARLEVQLARGGRPLGQRRTLVELGGDDVQDQLLGSRAIFLAGGQFAPAALRRRYFAEWRVELETRLAREAATEQPVPAPAGPSFEALASANQIIGQVDRLLGEPVRRFDPVASVRTAYVDIRDTETADIVRSLDVLHDGDARHADGTVSPRLGLALATVEAWSLGGEGVNTRLADSPSVTVINPATAIPGDWPAAVTRTLAEEGGTLLATETGQAGWLIQPSGHLQARLFGPDAKGARAREAIAEFARIRKMLTVLGIGASGVGSPLGVSGAQLGGIVGLLDTDLRLWCFSTVMLGFVTDAIESGEFEDDAYAQAAEGCEIDPENLQAAYYAGFAQGYITGRWGDRATDAVKGLAGGSLPAVTEILVNTDAGALIELSGICTPIGEALRNVVYD